VAEVAAGRAVVPLACLHLWLSPQFLAMTLEELDGSFMLFGFFSTIKRPQVSTSMSLRI
jgi:hypothetical protein